ncbi:MAG: hypothetical protein ACPLRH_00165 [Desulfotomaculales bacterium]
MIKKLNTLWTLLALNFFAWLCAVPAWADVGGIAEKTAEETATKIVQLLNDVVRPLGALVIFVAVIWTAYRLIATAHNPEERAKALGAIPYIAGGAILIGGVMMFAGFLVNLMVRAGQ